MSLVAKFFLLLVLLSASTAECRELNILVLGEGVAANCNSRLYGGIPNVFQIGLDGAKKPARDPLDWADCSSGSIWIPVGRRVISAGLADQVVFMSLGIKGSQVRDWAKGGRGFAKLKSAMEVAKSQNIKFDYIFWYQGMSDGMVSEQRYAEGLKKVIRELVPEAPGVKWLIAQDSGCGKIINNGIVTAQRKVSANPLLNRYSGPNIALLHGLLFNDHCALKADGQELIAKQWFDSLVNAEAASKRYEKESLLYYFK